MFKRIATSTTCLLLLVTAILTSSCITQETGKSASSNVVSSKPIIRPGDNVITSSSMLASFTLDDQIKISQTAVIGKVIEILPSKQYIFEEKLTNPYSNAIYTEVIIEIDQYLYGEPQSKRIMVRVNEGRVGNTVMRSEDEAKFTLGEQCALFLCRPSYQHIVPEGFDDSNYYILWGLCYGKYEIENGTLIGITGDKITLADIKQKVSAIRGITK